MSFTDKYMSSQVEVSERKQLTDKYARARTNLLLVVAFTVLNVVLLVTNSNSYFLWSAYVPFMLADMGMFYGGMYPDEVYTGDLAGMDFLGEGYFITMLATACMIVLIYLLCWIFSKKNKVGWMIFALALFGIDTVLLLLMNGINTSMLFDIVFHGWVVISLFLGISAGNKLKNLPPEEEQPPVEEEETEEEEQTEDLYVQNQQ